MEFKQGLDKNLQKTFVAFANARGGTVIVGVAPKGAKRIVGIEGIPNFEEDVNGKASTPIPPLRVEVAYASVDGRTVAFLKVPPLREREWAQTSDGCVLERMGPVDRRLFGSELERFILGRAAELIETRVVTGATTVHLDRSLLRDFLHNWLDQSRIRSVDEESRRANLLTPADEVPLATMLLFGKAPQRWYPRLGIDVLHYGGMSTETRYAHEHLEVRGCLQVMIDEARELINERLGIVAKGFDNARMRCVSSALKEALVNAVGHRDYSLIGATIRVRIYDDLIEIESPGTLAGHISLENLTRAQYSRNAYVMRGLEYLKIAEQRGQGINRMRDWMMEALLPPPEFNEGSRSFVARLRLRRGRFDGGS